MRLTLSLILLFVALLSHTAHAQQPNVCRNGIRVRRPYSSLSRQERQAFAQAIMTMKRTGAMDRLNRRHRDGMQYHMTTQFLPMHRAMLVDFELELMRANPAVTALPYWDELADSRAPLASSIFSTAGLGVMRTGPLSAPFQGLTDDSGRLVTRRPANRGTNGRFSWIPGSASMAAALRSFTTYSDMSNTIEIMPHNSYHGLIGGHMGNPSISPADPVFWLHHAYIDLLWATWQGLSARNFVNLDTEPGELRVVANAGTVLYESQYTNRDMLFYQQRLCYRYDAVNGNVPRNQRASRLMRELAAGENTNVPSGNSTEPTDNPRSDNDDAGDQDGAPPATNSTLSVIQGVEPMPEDLIAELMPMVSRDVAVQKVRKAEARINAIAQSLKDQVQARLGDLNATAEIPPEVSEKVAELIPSVQELVSQARKFVETEVKDDGAESKIPEVVEQAKTVEGGGNKPAGPAGETGKASEARAGSSAAAGMGLAVVVLTSALLALAG